VRCTAPGLAFLGVVDPSQRASDAERDKVVADLRQHLVDGRLTLEEFTDRVGTTLAARTHGELAVVVTDLPTRRSTAPARDLRTTRLTGAAFGHAVRRGRIRLPRRSAAFAGFADLDLDLRDATIEHEDTLVTVIVGFGNVDVYVPDGVNVVVSGMTIFGHCRQWGFDAGRADAPTIRIRVVGMFATADVWSVPRDVVGDYGEVFRAVQERHRSGRPAVN
jgi:uncharacterized protein DUF1707/cell wall-active antibiotic response 4TMS protein YvqF